MNTKKMSSNESSSHAVAIGLGLAAVAAAAAGAYYLYGAEKAPQNRKKLASWMLRMKAEVMDEIEKLKDVNKEAYDSIVANVAEKYKQLKNTDPVEVMALASNMRGHWKNISAELKKAGSDVKKASNSGKKTAKNAKKK